MASTYSTSLKLELIGNGDQSGTWGTTTNNNLGTLLEQAITGVQAITMSNVDYTLSNLNGVSDEARNAVLVVGGTNSAIRNIIAPAVNKTYIIVNNTSGGYAINIKTPSSTGVNIPNGTTGIVYCDGTEFFTVTKGYDTANTANTLVLRDGSGNFSAGAITATALTTTGPITTNGSIGTAGQALLSQGAGLPPTWGAAFVSGMIMLWSGSIASIPSGWLLCNGSSGTPDLRDRFVVGAGSTYAVGATGGTADSIVVSHTHTGTASTTSLTGTLNATSQSNTTGTVSASGIVTATNVVNSFVSGSGGGTANSRADYSINATHNHSLTIDSAGASGTNANLPPYYALCYIMKA